ncbi:hypothetical protein JCM10212_002160 [Sporobolomyces blumeae]
MPSSDYKHKPGGGLKLKGSGSGASDPSKKKKKKSSTSKKLREGEEGVVSERAAASDDEFGREEDEQERGSSSAGGSTKTKAQLKFEEVQRKRLLEKAAKAATKSHKERVAEFNEKLENLSEHYDTPKIGPG